MAVITDRISFVLQNFIICVNAVIPSAIYLAIGVILKASGAITDKEVKRFTHIVFLTLYPFMMFDNLYDRHIEENMNMLLVVYGVAFTLLQFAISWIFVCKIEKDNYQRGAMIQGLYRGNFVLMGLPIAINLFGKGNVATVAVLILFIVPIYNASAVILFERFRGGKADILTIIRRILTNPIIEGAIAAMVLMAFHIKLPETLHSAATALSDATSPVALILLGAGLNIKAFQSDRGRIAICTVGKLIVFPAICLAGAAALGFTGVPLIALTLMVGTPDALAAFTMASSMEGNGELAGELVVITTMLSCITMPLWLFALKTAGLF